MSHDIAQLFLLGSLLIIDSLECTDVIKEWEVLLPTKQRPPYVGKVFAYVTFHCFTGVLGATLLLLLLFVRMVR
jgi:hypothetical protein